MEKEVERESLEEGSYNNAVQKQKELAIVKEKIKGVSDLRKKKEEVSEIYNNFKNDEELLKEISEQIEKIKKEAEKEELKVFLSGKFDKNSALLEIQSGAGGRDAEDFVAMLLRMYQRFSEKKGFKLKTIYASYGEAGGPEGRTGIKKIIFEIKGDYAFGIMKKESGTHRLVRKSPFSSGGTRHTSFAQVEVFPVIKKSNSGVKIKSEDLQIDTFKASGPGGQNVNKRESAIRITHLPTGIVVSSQNERIQSENRRTAMSVLQSKLEKMKEDKEEEIVENAKGKVEGFGWGSQIRSYILHPYKLVKDSRINMETSNVEDVLDGDLDLLHIH